MSLLDQKRPTGFSKDDTLIVKGIAILAMLCHHLFLKGRFESYDLSFFPFTESQFFTIATFCKVCVGLFAFVSGYGLFCSLAESQNKSDLGWYSIRIIRSFADYWLIAMLAWILFQIVGGSVGATYFKESVFSGIIYMIFDFFGLSILFGTPTICGTWWYMGANLIFILLAPLIYWMIKRFNGVLVLALLFLGTRAAGGFPGGKSYLSFLPAFVIGMMCAKGDFFQRLKDTMSTSTKNRILLILALMISSFLCFQFAKSFPIEEYWDVIWCYFVIIYVSTIFVTVARIPYIKTILIFLGTYSGNIFIIHTFLRKALASSFLYLPGSFILVILKLLVSTLIVCLLLEVFKKVIKYDSFIDEVIKGALKKSPV